MLHTLRRCFWTPGQATGLGLERQGHLPPAGDVVPNPATREAPEMRRITGRPQAGVHGSELPAASSTCEGPGCTWGHHFLVLLSLPMGRPQVI